MKEIKQIIAAYEAAAAQAKNAVLATVVHIEGSSYRGPGARMLIVEDGAFTGAVSGGCLEGDVMRKAQLVMLRKQALLITYDTTDDEDATGLGVGLGCQGIIRILLEPVAPGAAGNPIDLLRLSIARREPLVLVTFFTPDDSRNAQQGTRLLVRADGIRETAGALPVAEARLQGDVEQALAVQAPAFVRYALPEDGQFITAFLEYVRPVPRLVIAGAGNDVMPVVEMADILGWDTILVDGRPNYASARRFPSCQLTIARPESALKQIAVDAYTAIVLMSHNYAYDKAVLAQSVTTEAFYTGILGPKKKRDAMLRELEEEGVCLSPAQLKRIHGPTGLDIGAETPEEIALSVISEIKAVMAGNSGKPLRAVGRIHRRNTDIVPSLETYGVLLLAAGKSQRLGVPKQNLLFRGDTLLRNAVKTAAELYTAAVVVVAGKEADNVREQLGDLPATVVPNTAYQEGIASSIRTGIQHFIQEHPQIKHVLILLCDMPWLYAAHLRMLIYRQQLAATPVAASYYENRKGVPALFEAAMFPQLLGLTGDTGAKHLIEAMGDNVVTVPFPEGAYDIDEAADIERLLKETTTGMA